MQILRELEKTNKVMRSKRKKIGAIILAAGKGRRMNSKNINKVALLLGNKPMILHIVTRLEKLKISPVLIVIGFAKKSILDLLDNNKNIIFVEQKKRLGTGHAVSCALKKVSKEITDLIILQGDDSAFYKEETIKALMRKHFSSNSDLTFLTIELDNPFGLGRVIRNEKDQVASVVEEKDASKEQKKIKEINTACYVFKMNFLRKYLKKMRKSKITGEYYLPNLIGIAIAYKRKVNAVCAGKIPWRGVNTKGEFLEAEKLFSNISH